MPGGKLDGFGDSSIKFGGDSFTKEEATQAVERQIGEGKFNVIDVESLLASYRGGDGEDLALALDHVRKNHQKFQLPTEENLRSLNDAGINELMEGETRDPVHLLIMGKDGKPCRVVVRHEGENFKIKYDEVINSTEKDSTHLKPADKIVLFKGAGVGELPKTAEAELEEAPKTNK